MTVAFFGEYVRSNEVHLGLNADWFSSLDVNGMRLRHVTGPEYCKQILTWYKRINPKHLIDYCRAPRDTP